MAVHQVGQRLLQGRQGQLCRDLPGEGDARCERRGGVAERHGSQIHGGRSGGDQAADFDAGGGAARRGQAAGRSLCGQPPGRRGSGRRQSLQDSGRLQHHVARPNEAHAVQPGTRRGASGRRGHRERGAPPAPSRDALELRVCRPVSAGVAGHPRAVRAEADGVSDEPAEPGGGLRRDLQGAIWPRPRGQPVFDRDGGRHSTSLRLAGRGDHLRHGTRLRRAPRHPGAHHLGRAQQNPELQTAEWARQQPLSARLRRARFLRERSAHQVCLGEDEDPQMRSCPRRSARRAAPQRGASQQRVEGVEGRAGTWPLLHARFERCAGATAQRGHLPESHSQRGWRSQGSAHAGWQRVCRSAPLASRGFAVRGGGRRGLQEDGAQGPPTRANRWLPSPTKSSSSC